MSKVAKIQWTRSCRTYIQSIFQYTVQYHRSKVAKIQWTISRRTDIRSILQITVQYYRISVELPVENSKLFQGLLCAFVKKVCPISSSALRFSTLWKLFQYSILRKVILFTAFQHLFPSISKAIFTICRSHFHVTWCEIMALCKGRDIFGGWWLEW